jgi:hypothetical protein
VRVLLRLLQHPLPAQPLVMDLRRLLRGERPLQRRRRALRWRRRPRPARDALRVRRPPPTGYASLALLIA